MTKLLDKAIEAARGLAPEDQDEIARAILKLAERFVEDEEDLDPADLEAIDRGLDDMRNGRFASDGEMEAVFRRFEK